MGEVFWGEFRLRNAGNLLSSFSPGPYLRQDGSWEHHRAWAVASAEIILPGAGEAGPVAAADWP